MAQPPVKALVSWSGGKDSAWALQQTVLDPQVEIMGLLTSFNEKSRRIAIHGVRRSLAQAQAEVLGLPLFEVPLPSPCPNREYETRIAAELIRLKMDLGISHIVFGDLFLQDIREYREAQMQELGLTPLFPIWDMDTDQLARSMMASGLKAVLSCVDTQRVPDSFSGKEFDENLMNEMPLGCDPCGENGEFHTFVYDGPMFSREIPIKTGRRHRDGDFVFTDILPA